MANDITYNAEVEATEETKKGNSKKKLWTALGIGAAGIATAIAVSTIIKKNKARKEESNEDDSEDYDAECEECCSVD